MSFVISKNKDILSYYQNMLYALLCTHRILNIMYIKVFEYVITCIYIPIRHS